MQTTFYAVRYAGVHLLKFYSGADIRKPYVVVHTPEAASLFKSMTEATMTALDRGLHGKEFDIHPVSCSAHFSLASE